MNGLIQAAATFLLWKEDPVPNDVNTRTGKVMVEMAKISAHAGIQIHVLQNLLPDYSKCLWFPCCNTSHVSRQLNSFDL